MKYIKQFNLQEHTATEIANTNGNDFLIYCPDGSIIFLDKINWEITIDGIIHKMNKDKFMEYITLKQITSPLLKKIAIRLFYLKKAFKNDYINYVLDLIIMFRYPNTEEKHEIIKSFVLISNYMRYVAKIEVNIVEIYNAMIIPLLLEFLDIKHSIKNDLITTTVPIYKIDENKNYIHIGDNIKKYDLRYNVYCNKYEDIKITDIKNDFDVNEVIDYNKHKKLIEFYLKDKSTDFYIDNNTDGLSININNNIVYIVFENKIITTYTIISKYHKAFVSVDINNILQKLDEIAGGRYE